MLFDTEYCQLPTVSSQSKMSQFNCEKAVPLKDSREIKAMAETQPVSSYKTPKNTLLVVTKAGIAKGLSFWWQLLALAVHAGGFIAMAGGLTIAISGALNELMEHKLVVKVGQVKYGGITYISCPNPAEVVQDVIRNRELVLFENIQANLISLDKLSAVDSKKLGINKDSVQKLKILTGFHKKIAEKMCKKNIKTIGDWILFIKKVSRYTF